MLGPEVFLNGSPTVSPTTTAQCASEFFPLPSPRLPASTYFFALSQAPPELFEEMATGTPTISTPKMNPASAFSPQTKPINIGVNVNKNGRTVFRKEALVATLMHSS